jgi:hypothetical protein
MNYVETPRGEKMTFILFAIFVLTFVTGSICLQLLEVIKN